MGKEKPAPLSSSLLLARKGEAAVSAGDASEEKTSVQVKFDPPMYKRLKIYGATNRKSNQDILHTAVQEYLERNGG